MLAAAAQGGEAQKDEREQLRAQRLALVATLDKQEAECQARFVVTSCLEEARARHRAALIPLRDQELRLAQAERQARAEQRRAAVAAKQAALPTAVPGLTEPELRVRQPAKPASPSPEPAAPKRAPSLSAGDAPARAADAAARVREAQERQQAAQAARERINQRLSSRRAEGRVAAPLPVPASGAR